MSPFAFNTPLIYYVYQLLTLSFTHLKDIFPFCRIYAFAHISSLFVARKLHYCYATTNFLHFFFAFLPFFTFSPTLLWQSLKMFFPFLLLTETTSITPKYLPYLSPIILSFLFCSYSSSDENQNFHLANLQSFQSYPIHFMLWNFSFTNLELSISLSDFSILQTETSNYAYWHQHRAATKEIFPSFYCRQLWSWNWRKKLASLRSKHPRTCFLSCCLFPL